MDHAGNVNVSLQIGYVAGLAAGKLVEKRAENTEQQPSVSSIRTKMALAGFTVGMVMNGLAETKFGMKIIHWENTPDPIDFAYGMVAATAAASLAPNVEQVIPTEYKYSK